MTAANGHGHGHGHPAARGIRPGVLADPMGTLRALGAVVSPDLDAYASGALPLSRVRCVLCGVAPCQCRQCSAPYLRWGADTPEPCGMTVRPDGRCPRGHAADDGPAGQAPGSDPR